MLIRFALLSVVVFAGVIASATGASTAEASSSSNAADAPPAVPACVHVATSSRYVPYGYNHIVILTNGCARAVSCIVSTDVNPEKQKVDVAAGSTTEVATYLGANAATFRANVGCR